MSPTLSLVSVGCLALHRRRHQILCPLLATRVGTGVGIIGEAARLMRRSADFLCLLFATLLRTRLRKGRSRGEQTGDHLGCGKIQCTHKNLHLTLFECAAANRLFDRVAKSRPVRS
jgi:hypothetical protein